MTEGVDYGRKLVRMANQISASVPDPGRAAEQTANHLRMFWSPAMVDDLAAAAERDPGRPAPAVLAALSALRPASAGQP